MKILFCLATVSICAPALIIQTAALVKGEPFGLLMIAILPGLILSLATIIKEL